MMVEQRGVVLAREKVLRGELNRANSSMVDCEVAGTREG